MVFLFLFFGFTQIDGEGASGPPGPLGPGITPQGWDDIKSTKNQQIIVWKVKSKKQGHFILLIGCFYFESLRLIF